MYLVSFDPTLDLLKDYVSRNVFTQLCCKGLKNIAKLRKSKAFLEGGRVVVKAAARLSNVTADAGNALPNQPKYNINTDRPPTPAMTARDFDQARHRISIHYSVVY